MRLYGTTPEIIAALIKAQNHNCGVCGGPLADESCSHVEHRHHGNKAVRSVSHISCNLIIGMAHESIPKLTACIDYLIFHEGQPGG